MMAGRVGDVWNKPLTPDGGAAKLWVLLTDHLRQ